MKPSIKMPSPAMVVALVALFVSLGGSAYAVSKVGTNQIKNNAVTTPKIKNNAVTVAKLKSGAVRGNRLSVVQVEGETVSMAVPSDGSYGIPEGLIYGFPVTCKDGKYSIVQGLDINEFSRARMDATAKELQEEADAVKHLF